MEQGGQTGLAVTASGRRLGTAWLILGIAALAMAGVFAVLLVVARTPGFEGLFPTQDFFRTALVIHVDQSVLIWFLAFAGVVWSLENGAKGSEGLRWLPLGAAVAGCALVAAAPFLGAGDPLLNNYVPVLQHPLFASALGLFGFGVLLQVAGFLAGRGGDTGWGEPLRFAAYTTAVGVLVAIGSLIWTWATLSAAWEGRAYYEYLFWGPGHAVQFAYTQLMLLAWLWLAAALGVPLRVSGRALSLLLLLGALPLAAVPIFHGLWPVDSAESRIAFTRLMQYGNGLAAVPIGLLLVEGLVRHGRKIGAGLLPAYRALVASLLLFGAGGLLGAAIGGVNTVIPAHYHGSIVGVTLGLMGLTYLLLPRLGFGLPSGRMARIQPTVYAIGQLLHIGGLAVSGAMGIQRKTAGSAQGLEGVYAKAAMGVMGLGGLLAVIGGILFVVVAWRCFLNRR